MSENETILNAETAGGHAALAEVMAQSYQADLAEIPAAWALARVVDGTPVSFALVDPDRRMAFPGGGLRYAFLCDVATRVDRRGEGHFRAMMEMVFARLRAAGIPLVITHGRHQLYRRFGFDVFTHHCGLFLTPEQIDAHLGVHPGEDGTELLTVAHHRGLLADLLLVTDVQARTLDEARQALRAAAALARSEEKSRILFEHPAAPSYGSAYPIHPTLETPLTVLARTCGGQICIQGADPEQSAIPDADWIKLLDAHAFVQQALPLLTPDRPLPSGHAAIVTDAGSVTLHADTDGLHVSPHAADDAIHWPSAALTQLVTGYRSAAMLDALHNTTSSPGARALLDQLFPMRWRLSRNEGWIYRV